MIGKDLPDLSVIRFHRLAITGRYAERFQRDALGIEHAEDVVVGDDEQVGWRAQRGIFGKQARIDVPVRADQGQVSHPGVELARHAALGGVRIKKIGQQDRSQEHNPFFNERGSGGVSFLAL